MNLGGCLFEEIFDRHVSNEWGVKNGNTARRGFRNPFGLRQERRSCEKKTGSEYSEGEGYQSLGALELDAVTGRQQAALWQWAVMLGAPLRETGANLPKQPLICPAEIHWLGL